MDQNMLNRLLRLAKKTGSPVILSDKDGTEPTVLLPLETYEAMIDGLMVGQDDFVDDMEAFEEYEMDFPPEVPMQEIDQDLPFSGEEDVLPEEVTLQDVPFDPPMAPQKEAAPYSQASDLSEERFYLEPIE